MVNNGYNPLVTGVITCLENMNGYNHGTYGWNMNGFMNGI